MKSFLSHIMCRQGGFFMFRSKKLEMNVVLCLILIVGIIPIFLTTLGGRMEIEDLLVRWSENNVDSIERQLPEIVAKQINMHMPEEAIKAQCVIARTQLMLAQEKGTTTPSRFTISELQELWGDQFEVYYQKLQELIKKTAGETLQDANGYIYAAYHQVSAGNTRNINEYYEKNIMPYLQSVNCHGDTTAEGYLEVYYWTKDDFLAFYNQIFLEQSISGGEDIQIVKRDTAGYVLQVQVGQTVYEGEEFRDRLQLPSACFDMKVLDGDVRIVTMGSGHGFGLSQHMAKVLAEEGKNYKEILQYFYPGVVLTE